jgi:small subunit ribosomal protein S11
MGKKRVIQKSGDTDAARTAESSSKISSREIKRTDRGRVYIQASYNNTIVSLTDERGNLLAASSAGMLGFRGPKKATPYAATKIVESLGDRIKKHGLKEVEVFVKGIGSGRESAVRSLPTQGLSISSIKDITPVPHNGTRPPKRRRV